MATLKILTVFLLLIYTGEARGGYSVGYLSEKTPVGPVKKTGQPDYRDSVLSARLLFILNNQQGTTPQVKSRLAIPNLPIRLPLPDFLQVQKQGTNQYQYKFDPVLGKINMKLFLYSNQVSSFTFGVDSRLYRHSRIFSNNFVTRLVKFDSKNQNEIYLQYQFHKFALISSWEFSSFRNKFDENVRWDEDKIKIVVSYLF